MTVAALTSTKPHRPRYERRARFPIANPYRASDPPKIHLRRFVDVSDGLKAKLMQRIRDCADDPERLQGVAFAPVRLEAELLWLQLAVSRMNLVRDRAGHIRIICGTLPADRRRRPTGISDAEAVRCTGRNYHSVQRARRALTARHYVQSKQPHKWDEEKHDWRGLANLHVLTHALVKDVGMWAELVADFEGAEAERKASDEMAALLAREKEAARADARATRGIAPPEIRPPKKPDATAAQRILDLDERGRARGEVPIGLLAVMMEVRQDEKFKDAPPALQRAEAEARWAARVAPPS